MLELKEALCTEVFLCENALYTGKALGLDASVSGAIERMQRLSAGASASASAGARAGSGSGTGARAGAGVKA